MNHRHLSHNYKSTQTIQQVIVRIMIMGAYIRRYAANQLDKDFFDVFFFSPSMVNVHMSRDRFTCDPNITLKAETDRLVAHESSNVVRTESCACAVPS